MTELGESPMGDEILGSTMECSVVVLQLRSKHHHSSTFSSLSLQQQQWLQSVCLSLSHRPILMAFRVFLSLSFVFLFSFPSFTHASLRKPTWLNEKKTGGSVLQLQKGAPFAGFDPTRVTQLSWFPRAFLYDGFLSEEECDHLIDLARGKMEKSRVHDDESGESIISEARTSSGMFIDKAQDEIVKRIEARIAAWTFLPEENGESIQILHYENGQEYVPHFDYSNENPNQALGGLRFATVLMYLSNVEKGGETVFPNSEAIMVQPKDDSLSDCAKNGYAVKPKKGDTLLFFSLHPDATTDPISLHGSCPVIEGEKWSATKWIHVRSYDKPKNRECVDENENCSQWAADGECEKNSVYMVGSEGFCRRSCKVC